MAETSLPPAPAAAGEGGTRRQGVKSDPTSRNAPSSKTDAGGDRVRTRSKKSDDAPKVEGPKADNSKSPGGTVPNRKRRLAGLKSCRKLSRPWLSSNSFARSVGDSLGEMGKPVKVTYEGRSFYLCCKSCEAEVKADPKAFIAKLDKKDDKK